MLVQQGSLVLSRRGGVPRRLTFVALALWVSVGYLLAMVPQSWLSNTVSAATLSDSRQAYASSCVSSATSGSVAWSNPSNATNGTTDVSTTGTLDRSNPTTHDLRCTGFNFSAIPVNATIDGITVIVNRSATNAVVETPVRLLKAGTKVGTDKGDTTQPAPGTSLSLVNFGGGTNLWGTTWAVSDITNANFGVTYAISNPEGNPSRTVSVNYMQIKIDYTYTQTFTQTNYRIFESLGSNSPGAPKAAINQAADIPAFVPASGETIDISSITAGKYHSCALTADGTAYCWGRNTNGQLGDGTTTARNIPTAVDTSLKFSSISAGGDHTCAVSTSSQPYCWGSNGDGQLGVGFVGINLPRPTAVSSASSGADPITISAGDNHTCGLDYSGAAYCWGANNYGQLGTGDYTGHSKPNTVSTSLKFSSIRSGGLHTCALTADGTAYCWGHNIYGQLGDGTKTDRGAPAIVDTSLKFSSIRSGGLHTCALTADGTAYCWGYNDHGELGDGTMTHQSIPTAVNSSLKFSSIGIGTYHTCATAASSGSYCWGWNSSGQVGNGLAGGQYSYHISPAAVDSSLIFNSISAGGSHSCALTTDGTVHCWGRNADGTLGDGTNTDQSSPVQAAFMPVFDPTVTDTSFRLRMAVELGGNPVGIGGSEALGLQYALLTADSCDLQATGFTLVTRTSPVGWHHPNSPVDGAVPSPSPEDPVTQSVSYQNILTAQGEFSNRTAVAVGESMLWDFALKVNDITAGNSYCLRIAEHNGAELDGYQQVAQINLVQDSQVPEIAFVDSSDQIVSSPNFSMPSLNTTSYCQVSSFGLGAGDHARLRISQGAAPTGGFSITVAPTNGQSATWSDSVGGNYYDFNDPSGSPAGCSSGSDGDMYAGQLTVDRSASTLTPSAGCDLTGMSYAFGPLGFDSGINDSISLVTGSSSVGTACSWFLSDTIFSQTVPPDQPAGEYQLELTVTVVAS